MRLDICADAEDKDEDKDKDENDDTRASLWPSSCPVVLCASDHSALRIFTHLGTAVCVRPVVQLERATPGTRIDLRWCPKSKWTARTRVAPGGARAYRW